jgi:hypothetical protein
MPPDVLSPRALNRALLQRHGLLERSATPVVEMLERLVGLQAQEPTDPYLALWSRIRDFRPEQLAGGIEARDAVRAQLMRATIHLVAARDCLAIAPLTAPVLAAAFRGGFAREVDGADMKAIVAAGRALLAEQPRTRAELGALLGPRAPGIAPATLALAVTFHSALVQVPPRGLWGQSGQARWAPVELWLGGPLEEAPSAERLVSRYLAAFGPAAVGDMRTWSRMTGLRAVFERLRPELRTFHDRDGRELFDVPDGALPDPETPAPPRFLPEYDNLLLSHEDRSRVLAGHGPGPPLPEGRWKGMLLVDGFYRANWRIADAPDRATLTVDRFRPLPSDPAGTAAAIEAEAAGLLKLVAPASSEHRVRFEPGLT